MAELVKETSTDVETVQEDRETREDEAHDSSSEQPNPKFLLELNLLVMVLSLFSPSPEECSDCADKEMERIRDIDEAKACISKLHTRRRDIHDTKLAGRRSQRVQPMIKDCRHGRRM